jgi:hypothetical protein
VIFIKLPAVGFSIVSQCEIPGAKGQINFGAETVLREIKRLERANFFIATD